MKSIKNILCSATCFALLMSSCTDTKIDSQPELPKNLEITSTTVVDALTCFANDDHKFNVESNSSWDITITQDSPEWCTLSSYSSDEVGLCAEIIIEVSNNNSSEPRTATISIVAEGVSEPSSLTLTQNGYSPELNVTEAEGALTGEANVSTTFTVESTSAWEIAENEHFSFSPSRGEGTPMMAGQPVVVTATTLAANNSGENIVTDAVVTNADGEEQSVELIQLYSSTMEFTTTALTFVSGGESQIVGIDSNYEDWQIVCEDPSVEFTYTKDSNSQATLTLGANLKFATRIVEFTLYSETAPLFESNTLAVTQAMDYGTEAGFGNVAFANGAVTTTLTAARSRFVTKSDYGLGSYEIEISDYNVDNTVTFLSIQMFNANRTTDPTFNFEIYSNRVAYTLHAADWGYTKMSDLKTVSLAGVEKIKWTLLPVEGDDSLMALSIWYDDTLVVDNYKQKNFWTDPTYGADYSGEVVYMGLRSWGYSSAYASDAVTFDSFNYVPYSSVE